jgi:uncharacterized protein
MVFHQREVFMGFEQYHEPVHELSQQTRTFARIIVSLQEECEAINWYEQRLSVEQDQEAKKILQHAQEEEFLHFCMDLEFLLRRGPERPFPGWRYQRKRQAGRRFDGKRSVIMLGNLL